MRNDSPWRSTLLLTMAALAPACTPTTRDAPRQALAPATVYDAPPPDAPLDARADAPPPDALLPDVADASADASDAASPLDATDAPPRDAPDAADAPPRDVADASDAPPRDVADASDAPPRDVADASDAASDDAGDATSSDAATPLMIGLTVHLEGASSYDSAYAAALQSFADTFADAGAVLTLEPRDDVLDGGAVGPTLTALEVAGHGLGSHAAAGMESGLTPPAFTGILQRRRASLQTVAARVDHVSGICSPLDFIDASSRAGFTFTTGATAACILAMTERPAGYEDLTCASADDARCHAIYPTELTQRIHPWRARDGAHWLTDDATGRVVVIPSSGSVPCFTEEAASDGGLTSCRLEDSDVTTALADLDAAIAAVDPSRVNTYYWVWGNWNGSSSGFEATALTRLLTEVRRRVDAGQLRWATAGQMYDAYVAWEATHR